MTRAAILLACVALAACQPIVTKPVGLLVRKCTFDEEIVVYRDQFWLRYANANVADQPIRRGALLRDICPREEP